MNRVLNNRKKPVLRSFFCFLLLTHLQAAFAAKCWSDADLSALETSQTNAAIYIWSPRMALSVLHADDVALQAQAAGLNFVPIVDGRVPPLEWQSSLRALTSKQPSAARSLALTQSACTSRLAALDAYQHFPAVFVLRAGYLQAQKWTGAMNPEHWAVAFKADLNTPALRVGPTPVTLISDVSKAPTRVAADAPAISATASAVPLSDNCIAANQFVALPAELAGRGTDQAVALGAYERISPDGRFVLRSYSGKDLSTVSLVELPSPTAGDNKRPASVTDIFQTPLSNEAFPVQGTWRYIVNTTGEHYLFGDLVKQQKQAKPYFQGGMSGFYAAAAELGSTYPIRSSNPVQIRSLSWPNLSADSETTGEGMLTSRTIMVDPEQNRLLGTAARVNHCLGRVAVDGSLYSLPMISVNGKHFSALPQRPVNQVATMRIFGFGVDGKQCVPEQQFTSPSGKVTFGFPAKSTAGLGLAPGAGELAADLVYEYRGQAWWYSSQRGTAFNLAPVEDPPVNPKDAYWQKVVASAFPGLTRDGRVIYAATWQICRAGACADEAGYVVSDPYQSNAYRQRLIANERPANALTERSCIATSDVLKERADFARFHRVPLR